MSVTQIAHAAKSLLPVIDLLQSSSQQTIAVAPYLETFHTAVQNLRDLRPRFDSVVRDLDPVEDYARKLGIPLHNPNDIAADSNVENSQLWASIANVDPGLVDTAAIATLQPREADTSDGPRQGRQTSGSGAIQALLSLSGRAKEAQTLTGDSNGAADEQASSAEGLNAWWASVLSGTVDTGQTGTGAGADR